MGMARTRGTLTERIQQAQARDARIVAEFAAKGETPPPPPMVRRRLMRLGSRQALGVMSVAAAKAITKE